MQTKFRLQLYVVERNKHMRIVITCLACYLLQGLIRHSCNVWNLHILSSYKKCFFVVYRQGESGKRNSSWHSGWRHEITSNLLLANVQNRIRKTSFFALVLKALDLLCLFVFSFIYASSEAPTQRLPSNDLYYVKRRFYMCRNENLVRPLHHKYWSAEMQNICSQEDVLSLWIDKDRSEACSR